MRALFLLLVLGMTFPLAANAQTILQKAEGYYYGGNFDKVCSLLEGKKFEKGKEVKALELLAKAHLEMRRYQQADSAAYLILKQDPYYFPTEEGKHQLSYAKLFNRYNRYPFFELGMSLGVGLSRTIHFNKVLSASVVDIEVSEGQWLSIDREDSDRVTSQHPTFEWGLLGTWRLRDKHKLRLMGSFQRLSYTEAYVEYIDVDERYFMEVEKSMSESQDALGLSTFYIYEPSWSVNDRSSYYLLGGMGLKAVFAEQSILSMDYSDEQNFFISSVSIDNEDVYLNLPRKKYLTEAKLGVGYKRKLYKEWSVAAELLLHFGLNNNLSDSEQVQVLENRPSLYEQMLTMGDYRPEVYVEDPFRVAYATINIVLQRDFFKP
ncbi:hypothetical protein [Algivirga pacifica]|uniref:Outer membrane protein beta-barrel domain-containing protein n=1 Tax=Algivirga pacifica TaxID=1162670 RepID=A0ABP9DBN5_9BACT